MKTLVTDSTKEAAAIIRAGGIVAFPTETVYGLGADVFDESAIAKVFEAKGRPSDNPLIVHISRLSQIDRLVSGTTESAQKLIEHFFPGPLTVVLAKSAAVPKTATAGLETVAIRMPDHVLANEFIDACATPLVAPSANLSGKPSPTTWRSVQEDLDGAIDCILRGDTTQIGLESTVVDCTGGVPLLLRKGSVSLEQIREILPDIENLDTSAISETRSPGLKHKHYSPAAKVRFVRTGEASDNCKDAAYIGITSPDAAFGLTKICESKEEYARVLFEFFRECDRQDIDFIFCEPVEESGIGAALMDRIRRAGFH